MGIKTGTGGFDLDVDGKVKTYDFDVGSPSEPGLDPFTPDHGDVKVDDSTKDLSKKTKTTLSKWLKSQTQSNAYPIDGKYSEGSISDKNGAPPTLPEDPTNNPQYDEGKRSATPGIAGEVAVVPSDKRPSGPDGWPKGSDGSSTTLTDPAGQLTGKLQKGRPYDKKTDGNHLLPSVTKDKLPDPLGGYVSAVLSNNRFTSAAPLTTADLNSNSSRQGFNPKYTIRGKSYTANQLAQVGPMLSLRGSQEFPAAFNDKVNPTDAGSTAGAILPSPNQLGVLKINNLLLEAKDALEHLDGSELSASAEFEISPLGNQSWGALNNVEEPFNGLLNLGMIAMALAFQVALTLVFEGLALLISLLGGAGAKVAPGKKRDGTHIKGRYLAPPPAPGLIPSISDLLGIRGSIFPFSDALTTGTQAFFLGAEQAKAGLGSALLSAVTSAVSSAFSDATQSGYLIIISRLIVRTGQTIASAISDIGKAFASNPLAGVEAIMGLITVIKESKLIAAINIFTTIGDAIMAEETDPTTKLPLGQDPEGLEKGGSKADAYPDAAPGASVRKSRLQGVDKLGIDKLAWSSNRAPASYLIPDSILTMQFVDTKLGAFRGVLGSRDPYGKTAVAVQKSDDRTKSGARIPRDPVAPTDVSVKTIEAALDAEYMPFYFHDLRTNEIIGFQAFLASLTDDYSVNYESPEGYGRVDPIKIYKSTTRRISMSFYVAALDRKDFEDMWIKINKLVTLLYPQYTKGRLLTDGTNSFVQPFSQLIGASPLIRLRLGDLLRSNYSRFALARLFGAADDDMMLDGQPIKFSGAGDILKDLSLQAFADKIRLAALDDASSVFQIKKGGFAGGPPPSTGISIPIPSGPSTPDQAPHFNVQHGDLRYFKFTTTSANVDKTNARATMKVDQYSVDELVALYGMNTDDATAKFNEITATYGSSDNIRQKVLGGAGGYVIPFSELHMDPTTLTTQLGKISTDLSSAVPSIDTLSTFLDIEKNALVKSFRSVQGKGLAGVIESMNFDWYDKVTWATDGVKAPKMCKVTLSFAPIHDVSPGIDHMGYNRAPVYPVGNAMGHSTDPDAAG